MKTSKVIAAVAGVAAGTIAALYGYARIIDGRSLRASLCEWTLSAFDFKKKYSDQQNARLFMEKEVIPDNSFYRIPRYVPMHVPVCYTEMEGLEAIVLNGDPEGESQDKPTVLYLHGGAYVAPPLPFHWAFLDALAKQSNARVVVPFYPLAPVYTFQDAFPPLTRIYLSLLAEKGEEDIIVMGDSAGGGLAAALCESLAAEGLAQPSQLILLSPWVDLSMTNPELPRYETVDPVLGIVGQEVMGRAWAGDADIRDYRLSPLYGDVTELQDVTVFTGTHEILYPDSMKFFHKVSDAGVRSQVIVGHNLDHVYPLYPTPEAKKAIEQIASLVKDGYRPLEP